MLQKGNYLISYLNVRVKKIPHMHIYLHHCDHTPIIRIILYFYIRVVHEMDFSNLLSSYNIFILLTADTCSSSISRKLNLHHSPVGTGVWFCLQRTRTYWIWHSKVSNTYYECLLCCKQRGCQCILNNLDSCFFFIFFFPQNDQLQLHLHETKNVFSSFWNRSTVSPHWL